MIYVRVKKPISRIRRKDRTLRINTKLGSLALNGVVLMESKGWQAVSNAGFYRNRRLLYWLVKDGFVEISKGMPSEPVVVAEETTVDAVTETPEVIEAVVDAVVEMASEPEVAEEPEAAPEPEAVPEPEPETEPEAEEEADDKPKRRGRKSKPA